MRARLLKSGPSFGNYKLPSFAMLSLHSIKRLCSMWTSKASPSNVNFEKLFTEQRVQNLLKRLTGMDATKIFSRFHNYKPKLLPERPAYLLASETDLEDLENELRRRCEQHLQFPPFKHAKPPQKCTILSKDTELAGFDNAKIVFTDTSKGVHHYDRTIVVREPDGTLRTATNDEKYRMIKVYYPIKDQRVSLPMLFKEPYFTEALTAKKYRYILDWACLQLEPDDEQYVKIAKTVYDHCDSNKAYDVLWSTRHYGNLVFYLVINNNHETLLEHLLLNERISEAADLVRLFYICYPAHHSLIDKTENESPNNIVRYYINNISKNDALLNIIKKRKEANS